MILKLEKKEQQKAFEEYLKNVNIKKSFNDDTESDLGDVQQHIIKKLQKKIS